MFFKFISRIYFLIESTNQHGVHSPFVFDFVTKGLYQKATKSGVANAFLAIQKIPKKEYKILSKIVSYFQIDTIYTSEKELENTLGNNYNILFIITIQKFSFDKIPTKTSKLIVVFHDIYTNKLNQEKWLELYKNPKATVTIDLFYFGLIFFRKAQAKEHFKIRV